MIYHEDYSDELFDGDFYMGAGICHKCGQDEHTCDCDYWESKCCWEWGNRVPEGRCYCAEFAEEVESQNKWYNRLRYWFEGLVRNLKTRLKYYALNRANRKPTFNEIKEYEGSI